MFSACVEVFSQQRTNVLVMENHKEMQYLKGRKHWCRERLIIERWGSTTNDMYQ